MKQISVLASIAWLASLASAKPAAACLLGILFCGGDTGGGSSVPEFDGPAGVAALALLVSVGLLIYNRFVSR
jgi:hypothetical protein